jgi:putative transposase
METTKRYPSDMSDAEWQIISPMIPPSKSGGRKRTTDMRAVVNAIFYIERSGCQWRMLPKDFPPRSTVGEYFYQWRDDGTTQKIHDALREQVRQQSGKASQPTAAIVDSQSVKTTEKGGSAGMMQAKKSKAENATFLWTHWDYCSQ